MVAGPRLSPNPLLLLATALHIPLTKAVAGRATLCYTRAEFGLHRLRSDRVCSLSCGWFSGHVKRERGKDIGRVDVSEPASISASIAGRYATAIFDLSREAKGLKALETDVADLEAALDASDDLRALIASPVVTREDQARSMAAIATKMKLSATFSNALALMADKRRLFVLPHLLAALNTMIADEKGEVTADVTAAQALTKAQSDALAKSLQQRIGKTVKLNVSVDESLIGGLVVKVGSKMIDTSIRAKLGQLQNAMKEVG